MPSRSVREWIRSVERSAPEEQWVLLCFLAGTSVQIDADELNGAVRRAELVLAAGGDPRRRLELHGRAVTALAEDLDAPERRAELQAGLAALLPHTEGLRGVGEALRLLQRDGDIAWQSFAMALLAESQAGEED